MIVSDPKTDSHTVSLTLVGTRPGFSSTSTRTNPAQMGLVTGFQTYHSFLKSIDAALVARRNNSFQLC
jgi:hypothetical protein